MRNKTEFWKYWAGKYPETLSTDNLGRMKQNLSPIVDARWVEHFPEHQRHVGEVLAHHHIDHGHMVTPLPYTVHQKQPGFGIFHNLSEGRR